VVVLDGERREVEVDLARSSVQVGGHEWPIHLGVSSKGSVSFEILGERVEVRSEAPVNSRTEVSLTVNGELHTLAVESATGARSRGATSPGESAAPGGPAAPRNAGGPGHAVFPPMPGKVLEVRVRNGEPVELGQVLLVVEAMKMRNDVTAPVAGAVAGLVATPGMNVSARDELLRIVAR
jgi:glutaconyl-CoA/methylmalonyl-CoA decarboxylase subunit gamma